MTGQGRCSGGGRPPTPASSDSDNSIVAREWSPQRDTAGVVGITGFATDARPTAQGSHQTNSAHFRVRPRADGRDCIKRMRKEKQRQRGGHSSDDDANRCNSGNAGKDHNNRSKAVRRDHPSAMSASAPGKELSDAVSLCRAKRSLSA